MEVYRLANIKSAKKRILVNETKAARNKAIKSKVKTAVKKLTMQLLLKTQRLLRLLCTQRSWRFPKQEAKVFITKRLFPERSPVCQKL